jgi:hypothetical protein
MKMIRDAVLEHAEKIRMKRTCSTDDGLKFLDLPNRPDYIGAANLYLEALSIINFYRLKDVSQKK